ncbi:hypothetical protein SAMN05192541_1143 [Bradyrhizobium arachidis]|nr:hypothetical protein SAMN05192541_1143 [Bradyrhizobium arachidis]
MSMPQPRLSLRQIGCGDQWHQRSADAADVPLPVDLEWPRRAIVGAIVVIGATGRGTSAEGSGCFVAPKRPKDDSGIQCVGPKSFRDRARLKKSDDCAIIVTVKHRTMTRQFDLRSCHNTNALADKQERGEVRSGESATLACDELTVPPTGRIQQHEQMEAARRGRILGSSGRSRVVVSLPAVQLTSNDATSVARMR